MQFLFYKRIPFLCIKTTEIMIKNKAFRMRFPKKRPENASLLVRAAEKADGVKIALLCAQVVKESLRQVDAVFYLSCAED